MNSIFIFSIIFKGVGAVLEILLQIFLTREMGVSGYGNYSTWINAADLVFWVFFSGIIKCNTFYLSLEGSGIARFKKGYYTKYVLPVLCAIGVVMLLFTKNPMLCFVILAAGVEVIFYDKSSELIARNKPNQSLIGEYILGRVVLLIGAFVLAKFQYLKLGTLLMLYLLQFVLVVLFFCIGKKREVEYEDFSHEVSIKKWGAYQWADAMHAMIQQMPVVIQYFFGGAFEAGVVSIVLLVKKLITFISGPTAKIFLPEFSRLYRSGQEEAVRECYASIMRLQMLFVGPLAVVLLGFPQVILKILAEELIQYVMLFVFCSFVFLFMATLGPCGGILQMTGNEKMDNRCRELSLAVMLGTMILFRKDSLFVLYGLCAQAGFEAVCKYLYICKWMKQAPVSIITYMRWWLLPAIAIIVTYVCKLQNSFLWMILFAGGIFALTGMKEIYLNDTLSVFIKSRGEKE